MPCLTESKCANCHAPIDINKGENGVLRCEYCNSVFTIAKKETDPAALDLIRLGNHELDICAFDNAFASFKKAAQLDPNEPEAFMGMALATHKVQYIRDGVNNCLQPICHEISDKAFTDDKNYAQALKLATPQQRAQYERSGMDIDYIKREFNKLRASGLDYDCFICVKVTDDETKGKTRDYKTADDIYFDLRGKGYKPFFSEREIQNRVGADYEALILYALYSSECMIVVCSNENYLQTDWVKNEYTRFLKLVADEEKESNSITIAFSGKPIERLPNRAGKLQGIDMLGVDPYGKIVKFVEEHTPEAKAKREQEAKQREREEAERKRKLDEIEKKLNNMGTAAPAAQTAATATISSLLKRVEQFMNMGDYRQATEYCNKVLDIDPECGEAWLRLFLASNSADSLYKLVDVFAQDLYKLSRDTNFTSAKRYADSALKEQISDFEDEINAKVEEIRFAKIEAERLARQQAEEEAIRKELAKFVMHGSVLEKYCGDDNDVVIPDNVTKIGDKAFYKHTCLTSITIPNSVTHIGELAFSGCRSLTSVIIPNSVTNIEASAFSGCSSLTSVIIPNSVTSIGEFVFSHSSSLTSVTIPNSVTSIGMYAFWLCENLKNVTIPNSVTDIANAAFVTCRNLESITIPNSVTSIGENAFQFCSSLTSITIPLRFKKSMKKIFDKKVVKTANITFTE